MVKLKYGVESAVVAGSDFLFDYRRDDLVVVFSGHSRERN